MSFSRSARFSYRFTIIRLDASICMGKHASPDDFLSSMPQKLPYRQFPSMGSLFAGMLCLDLAELLLYDDNK